MTDTKSRPAPMDWQAKFEANEAPWERGGLHPAFGHWRRMGLLEPGRTILVPGCGRAPEPQALARAGLAVTGIDIAPAAIDWQRRRFAETGLAGAFHLADGLDWRPDAPFDLYWEQTFLCAISPKLREAYERAAFDQIRPGGVLLALFMQKSEPGGPPYGCPVPAMRELFPDDRWVWPEDAPAAFPHPGLNRKAELAEPLVRR